MCLSGLYGLLAQLVTQRTHEIGVRIALGARRSQIVYLILGYASRLLLTGALIGLALAWLSTRLVAGFLYDVHPHDTLTVVSVALLLAIGGLAAASIPAARAASIDPVEALRSG
ncbi:FtsX-like permease family protein [Edaphobacter aggregans]|uniref:FtsX-like permease family protein n=1 Tax=Edaphobacter aggregans TaxID=570835 RepID=UPI0039186247